MLLTSGMYLRQLKFVDMKTNLEEYKTLPSAERHTDTHIHNYDVSMPINLPHIVHRYSHATNTGTSRSTVVQSRIFK